MNQMLLVLGMMLATYPTRLVPFYLLNKSPAGRAKRFFDALPVAAMAALIVPDAFTAFGTDLTPAIIGLAVAGVAAWFLRGLLLPLLLSVASVAAYLWWLG
ncbi:MAG: AzlD domain-containing protein [Spirochaetales bacterium]